MSDYSFITISFLSSLCISSMAASKSQPEFDSSFSHQGLTSVLLKAN